MNAAGDRFWVRADPAGSWPLMSRAVQLAPRNVEVLGAAAFLALALRQPEDAREPLARALAIDPENASAMVVSVQLAAATGDTIALLRRYSALTSSPGRALAASLVWLQFGSESAIDTLIQTPLGMLTSIIQGFDSVTVLLAQGASLRARGDTARRVLFWWSLAKPRESKASQESSRSTTVRSATTEAHEPVLRTSTR